MVLRSKLAVILAVGVSAQTIYQAKLDLFLQLVLTMNHTSWFETRRQMIFHLIFAEKSLTNLIWISET